MRTASALTALTWLTAVAWRRGTALRGCDAIRRRARRLCGPTASGQFPRRTVAWCKRAVGAVRTGPGPAPMGLRRLARRRQAAALEAQLPVALEAIARSLRAGASLRQAVTEAASAVPGPLGADLSTVARQVEHGEELGDALRRWADRRPLPGVRLAVAALALGASTGGAQARAIDGVASTVRDRLTTVADVRAHSASVRLSVLVIALSPVGFCAFAAATDPRTAEFLFGTPLGLLFLGGGLFLDALSALWMGRLARVVQ